MKKIIVAILLFVIGCAVLYGKFQEQDHRFLSLEVFGKKSDIEPIKTGELEKGEIIRGSFISFYDNVGQVAVRFNNNFHDSEDILLFRLKERGDTEWYYQAQYKTDQFLPHRLFPFGFPVISKSAGKEYEFELESLAGIQGRGISIDTEKPIFKVKTMFTKNEIISDTKTLIMFAVKKTFNLFHYFSIFLYSYSILIFYFFLNRTQTIKVKINSEVALIIKIITIISIIVYGVIIPKNIDDTTIAIVIFLYFLYSHKNKFESRVTIFFVAILLSISLMLLIFGNTHYANIASIWSYVFLCFAVSQQIAEKYFHSRPRTSLEKFISRT